MKVLQYIFLTLICTSITLNAQLDRSKVPVSAEAPEILMGEYQSFTLENGLQVFVVENHKLPKVSFKIRLDIPPFMENEVAGYSSFAGQLMGTATTTKTKAEIDEAVDYLGASLSVSSGGISASCLSKHKGELFPIFTDVLLNPVFNESELEKIKTRTLSSLAVVKNDPQDVSSRVQNKVLYGDHPYGEIMTEENVANITLEHCKGYYDQYFRPQIAYMAIVGDINKAEAEQLVRDHLSGWEANKIEPGSFKKPMAKEQNVALINKEEAVQSIIKVMYPIEFSRSSEDFIAARVMNVLLGGGAFRLYKNLREKHGYTYGAYSSLSADTEIGSFEASANVRNEVTDSSVYQILFEMNRLRDELVPEDELQLIKNYITGSFALAMESPQTIANFALNIAIHDLPQDYYKNYLKVVASLTPEDIQKAAQNYLHPDKATIYVVGKQEEIADQLEPFTKGKGIQLFNEDGVAIE